MQLYFSGESLRNTARSLRLLGVQVSDQTVFNNSPILLLKPGDPKGDNPFEGIKWEWQPKKGRKVGSADSFQDFLFQLGHLKKGEIKIKH